MIRSLVPALTATVLALTSSCTIARDAVAPPSDMEHVVQREAQAFVKAGYADGLSIAIVRDGQTQYFNFGTVSRDKAQLPSQDTVYEIGSVTKTFTGLLLAHALVEKKVGASDDIRRYLPGTYPGLEYKGKPITPIDLVTTTSALPDNLPDIMSAFKTADAKKAPFIAADMLQQYSTQAFLEDLRKVTLAYAPGTKAKHSNVAAELLGVILEKVYGRSYADLLASYVEKPLGMENGLSRDRLPQMATGYTADGTAMPLLLAPSVRAAGGLRYSTRDMARYVAAQLKAADPAIRLSQRPAWGDPGNQAIGFNWLIDKTIDGKARLSHTGGTFGFSSFVDLYPESHYGIVLLVNRSSGITQGQLAALSEHIVDGVWGKPLAVDALEQALAQRGYQDVDGTVKLVLKRYPGPHLSEDYINQWGYRLLRGGRARDAVGVFEYNTLHHPQSANAFDSLAEACRAAGDVERSAANYRRSLELNPANTHAQDQLRELAKLSPAGKG